LKIGPSLMSDLEHEALEREAMVQGDPFAHLTLDRSISLRWTLRDILANRTKFLPLDQADLQLLVEMGLVDVHDGEPSLTSIGAAAIE
jgi:hypothetical protein